MIAPSRSPRCFPVSRQPCGEGSRVSLVLLPLNKEPPFPSLALPPALSPAAEGLSPSEVSLQVCRVLAAPSLQGLPPAAVAGKPPAHLWRARSSSAAVSGALPAAAAGSHWRACGCCAEAKGFQRRGGEGAAGEVPSSCAQPRPCSCPAEGTQPSRERTASSLPGYGRGDICCPWSMAEARSVSSGRSTSLKSFYGFLVDHFYLTSTCSRMYLGRRCFHVTLGLQPGCAETPLLGWVRPFLRRPSCCGTPGSLSSISCRQPVPLAVGAGRAEGSGAACAASGA